MSFDTKEIKLYPWMKVSGTMVYWRLFEFLFFNLKKTKMLGKNPEYFDELGDLYQFPSSKLDLSVKEYRVSQKRPIDRVVLWFIGGLYYIYAYVIIMVFEYFQKYLVIFQPSS
jgi:hypothetical protein